LTFKFYLVLALGAVAIPLGLFLSMLCLYHTCVLVLKRRPAVCWFWGSCSIFGISDQAFRSSLAAVLQGQGTVWEEHEGGFHVPAQNIAVKMTVSPKGIVLLKAHPKDKAFLKEIAHRLRAYYAATPVEITPQYSIVGTILIVVGTVFVIVALSNMMISEKKLSQDIAVYSEQQCLKQMEAFAAKRGIDAHAFISKNEVFLHNCQQHIEQLIHERGAH
jgi:hypothetical protein